MVNETSEYYVLWKLFLSLIFTSSLEKVMMVQGLAHRDPLSWQQRKKKQNKKKSLKNPIIMLNYACVAETNGTSQCAVFLSSQNP